MLASDIGWTRYQWPVPWDGSEMTGRWLSRLTSAIAFRSMVLRVAVSKVRMPRSHRITCSLSCERTYSAASSHSSIVAPMPRFNITGLPVFPASASSTKFCMLRVPTWSTSEYCATASTSRSERSSVITGMPSFSPACASSFNPSTPSPWNE